MIFLIVIIFIIYAAIIFQLTKPDPKNNNESNLKISIVIAAKNEVNNVESLIKSIKNLHYDPDDFEVIFIDDNSTDGTYQKIKTLILDYSNFRVIQADNKTFNGKRGALQIGIEELKYNLIVITDADCILSKGFLKEYSRKFSNGDNFVFGIAPYMQNKNIINKISCFDNLWVHILTFSFAKIGFPYSSSARSFGFDKDSFNDIKGYENTLDALSGDDDLLLREAVKNKMRIGTITDPAAFVFTESKKTLKELIQQKSRHTSTSGYYLFRHKLLLGIWHLTNIIMLLSPLLVVLNIQYLFLFLLKIVVDIIIIKSIMKKFGYSFKIFEIIFLQFFYEILIIVYFIKSNSMKNKW